MTFIQKNSWPCKTRFQRIFPMLKVEIFSYFMNDKGLKDVSLESQVKIVMKFSFQVEGHVVCKCIAMHR